MRMKLIVPFMLLSVFSSAFAREIFNDGDWVLDDLSDRRNPNAACIAFTANEINGTTYRLEFVHNKLQTGPTDVFIRVQGRGASSFTATLKDETTVLSFANMGPTATRGQSLVWNIPQHTDKLMAQLEDRKNLKVKPADGSRDIRLEFSASGFKRVKEKMQERCLNKAPLYDLTFEESFAIKRDAINPLGITPDQVKELRRVLSVAYAVHLGINGTKDDLVKLNQKFQTQLTEAEQLTSRIERLGSVEIPSIIQSQQNNDSLEGTSRAQLQQTNVTISQQQSGLTAAQASLNTARTVIAPYESEHADRSGRASSARSTVNYSARRLSEIDNGLRNADARINQLSQEAATTQNSNARLENDLRYARQERMRAEADARSYNPRDERMRRLQSDPIYQGARRELPTLQNNIQIIENALNDARGKVLARETELRVCQTRTSFISGALERIPAQETPRGPNYNPGDRTPRPDGDRPNRPGRPDTNPTDPAPTTPTPGPVVVTPTPTPGPTTPTVPTTPTAIDCSSEQNAVNSAKQVVSNLETQQRDARSRFNDVERRMSQIENRVENEVARIRDELQNRLINTVNRQEGIEGQIYANIRRIEVISNVEIPQQQNTINSLTNERPGVQANYDQNLPVANRLEGELDAFERRVGWDAKVQAVSSAESLVSQRNSELNNSLSQKAALENQISRCQQERSRLAALLVDTQNRKLQAEARLVEVRKSLEPFELEKSRLEQSQADLKNQLAVQAQDFESKLP